MVSNSPNANHRAGLAFWAAGTEDDNNDAGIDAEDHMDGEESKDDVKGIERKSMYVVEFDGAFVSISLRVFTSNLFCVLRDAQDGNTV